MDKALWDALHCILKYAKPNGLEVECLAEFCGTISSPHFDGDYGKAVNQALYEWDI